MSPHDFRRFALGHELLARRPATRPVASAGTGATDLASTLASTGVSPSDRPSSPVRAGPSPAHPVAAGGEAEQGRMV